MKLRRILPVAALGIGIFAATAAAEGCSSSSGSSTGTAGGLQPPAAPVGAPAAMTGTYRTFALKQLFLGGTDRSGAPSADAWKSYGYDLDGKITNSKSTDVCTQAEGAQKSAQTDGNNGIDNSFGENILPIITSVAATAEADVNTSITSGSFTVMLDLQGVTDDAHQNNVGLSGQVLAGGQYDPNKAVPAFDLTTDWPVTPDILVDGKTIDMGSKIQLPSTSTYMVQGTFVTQAPSITLSLSIGGDSISLNIIKAIITFDHSAPNVAGNGTIAGVINVKELVDALQKVAGRLQTSLCNDSAAFEQIAQEIRQAADMMSTGTNGPGQACDAISIGIGFSAAEIKHPDKVAPVAAASTDPCAMSTMDAGTD